MADDELKPLLLAGDPKFWDGLAHETRQAEDFDRLFRLSALRKKAHARRLPRPGPAPERLRLAIMGGYNFYPLHELVEHLCEMEGVICETWLGAFDNYAAEIMEESGDLQRFKPDVALLMPPAHRCRYPGELSDPREQQEAEARRLVDLLLEQVRRLHERTRAEIIVANFVPPARHDPGGYRSRTLGSDWSFRKWVNLEMGLQAPAFLHICDAEFLAHRHGGLAAADERGWFESRQPGSPAHLVHLAREVVHIVKMLRRAPKKVLVLDLDDTLWGGVVAEDGLEGIELGDTSPRGEAFKAFQRHLVSLKKRGVLLAVASKNDHAKAVEVFEKHPEMLLRMEDMVSFKANWDAKSDSIRRMAAELNLGLDSFVFVDDNPAEIEMVRQFAPEVATILLGPDPSDYVAQLQDCRLFEPGAITAEDAGRTNQYRSEAQRQALQAETADMDAYWESLEMGGEIGEFTPLDAPRLAQLINRSNQFNLTTRRRTEADLLALMRDPAHSCFSFRLKDRFGDHGLISIVIAAQAGKVLSVDSWLMSCRVLKRQVEDAVLNELVRIAKERGCVKIEGVYLPTPKNGMVRDFYPRMGFTLAHEDEQSVRYEMSPGAFQPLRTKIKVIRRSP